MLAARMAQEQTTEAVSRAVTVVNRLSMDDRRAMKNLGGAGCGHFEISILSSLSQARHLRRPRPAQSNSYSSHYTTHDDDASTNVISLNSQATTHLMNSAFACSTSVFSPMSGFLYMLSAASRSAMRS